MSVSGNRAPLRCTTTPVNAGVRAIAVVGFHRCWRWRSVDYSWPPVGRSRDGVVEVRFFLFGRLAGGPLIGLRSIAIET